MSFKTAMSCTSGLMFDPFTDRKTIYFQLSIFYFLFVICLFAIDKAR